MTDKLVSEAVGARHVSAGQDGTPVSGGREKANYQQRISGQNI